MGDPFSCWREWSLQVGFKYYFGILTDTDPHAVREREIEVCLLSGFYGCSIEREFVVQFEVDTLFICGFYLNTSAYAGGDCNALDHFVRMR
jgi:hypothetical protein